MGGWNIQEELNRLFWVIKPSYHGENLNLSLSTFRGFGVYYGRDEKILILSCAPKKQKLRRCKKHKKYSTHKKHFLIIYGYA